MDTAQWPQISLVNPMDEIISATTTATTTAATCSRSLLEKKAKPPSDQPLNCPRCNSTNTKFCYYNNYSLSQPRYFCKTCKRYWTEGGSLRNVPVGGGSRKNKRSSSSSSSSSSKKISDQTLLTSSQSSQNPKTHEGQDLNLAFTTNQDYHTMPEFVELPNIENNNNSSSSSSSTSISSSFSAMEMLRSGGPSRGLSSFMQMQAPDSNSVYTPGFGFNFGLDGLGGGGYGSVQGVQEGAGRLLFPFEDLKPVSTTEFEQNKGHGDSSGYWTGMLGGGSW